MNPCNTYTRIQRNNIPKHWPPPLRVKLFPLYLSSRLILFQTHRLNLSTWNKYWLNRSLLIGLKIRRSNFTPKCKLNSAFHSLMDCISLLRLRTLTTKKMYIITVDYYSNVNQITWRYIPLSLFLCKKGKFYFQIKFWGRHYLQCEI